MSTDAAIRDLEESIRACVDHYEENTGMTPPSLPHPSDDPAALREQNRLLSEHNLVLLDQRREIAARVRLLEDAVLRDDKPALIRHHVARLAEMVR